MALLAVDLLVFLIALAVVGGGVVWAVKRRQKAIAETTNGKMKALEDKGKKNNESFVMWRQLVCRLCRQKVDPVVDIYQLDLSSWVHKKCLEDSENQSVERN